MSRVGIVALNTFREAVRDRVLYNLVFFALVMIAASILVGQISIGIEEMVIVTLGLSAISVIGLLIAVFIGVSLVSKEMEKRTLAEMEKFTPEKMLQNWFSSGQQGADMFAKLLSSMTLSPGEKAK